MSIFAQSPFAAQTNTAALTVGTASASVALPPLPPGDLGSGTVQVLLTNAGANIIFVAFGNSATVAGAPVSGTPANAFPLLPNTSLKFTCGANQYVAAISALAGNTLYITVGSGV